MPGAERTFIRPVLPRNRIGNFSIVRWKAECAFLETCHIHNQAGAATDGVVREAANDVATLALMPSTSRQDDPIQTLVRALPAF